MKYKYYYINNLKSFAKNMLKLEMIFLKLMNMLLELKNFLTFMKKKILNKLILIVRFIFNVLILKN